MSQSRKLSLVLALGAFVFNEWAFRFIFPLQPIDSFLRLMTLVLNLFVLSAVLILWFGNSTLYNSIKGFAHVSPRLTAFLVGSFISYCLLMAVEFSCRYYFKHIYEALYTESTFWEPSAVVQDSILGSALLKDTVISHAYVINDSLIYKRYYRTDDFGRRISPFTHPDSTYEEFAMVTGCSFAFGYGLPENQTLSYFLDSLTGLRGYNYAVAGHGTQQTLAILQSRQIHQEIQEKNGVLIHLFIDDHIPRLIGSRRLIKLWAKNFPYYYLDGKELKHDGSFWTGRHLLTRFYRAISQSAFIDLFDIDIPWYVSESHLKLFGSVLKEAENTFLQQYPNGKFLVVIGPNSKLAPRVSDKLEEQNIDFIDLSELLDKEDKKYKIHWTEAHPNGNYYREVAIAINHHLQGDN